MKTLRKSISIVLALVMLASIAVIAPTVANAGSYVQMFNIWGNINDYNDCRTTTFTLSSKTSVKFVFSSDSYSYCNGYYRLEVDSQEGATVLSETGILDGLNDVTYTVTLAAGEYTVYLYNNDDRDEDEHESLDYDLYAYRYYNPPVNPTSFKLNKTKVTLAKGKTYQLKATYKPTDATAKLTYSSSNTKVATVNSSGKITAKALGLATITAKKGNKKAKCTVHVNSTYLQIGAKKSKSLVSYVKKVTGYKGAKWSSNKKSVVTVTKKGTIKTKKHGIAKITAKIKGKSYSVIVYSYSKSGVKKRIVDYLKAVLIVPSSLKIGTVTYPAYNKCKVYFSAYNRYGQRVYHNVLGEMKKDILWISWDV